MTKVAITADIHFGVPGRLDDILWSMRVLREYCKSSNIDTVLILGDLFHDRRSIELDVLNSVINFFEIAKNDYKQQWVVFPGNHDMFLRHSWNINSLVTLKSLITVIEDIKILMVDEQRFWILPFVTLEKPYMKILRSIEKQYKDRDILLTHIGVNNAILNTCFLLKDWSTVSFYHSKFKRIYTGHFHSRQQVGENVFYPGSLIPFKFDEGDVPHGFYVLDIKDHTHKFINIWKAGKHFFPNEPMPPQFFTITDDIINIITESDISNGIVRIALTKDATISEKANMKDLLLKNGAKAVRWMNLKDKIEKQEVIAAKPTKNLFKSWVENDKNGTKGLDQKILFRINDEIIKEGDDNYVLEDSD